MTSFDVHPRWLARAGLACLGLAGVLLLALAVDAARAPVPAHPASPATATAATNAPSTVARPAAGALVIVSWNVENLFDPEDDPANAGDDEFTPSSWRRWTDRLYRLKLQNIADILAGLDGDIVCLAEVENRRVVEDLSVALAARSPAPYPFVTHRDSGDERGIDVAVLSRVEPERFEWLTPVPGQRDVVAVRFSPGGHPLTVIANHWKSRWDGVERTEPIRRREARAVAAYVDRLLARDPAAAIVVTGDFNDDIDGPAVAGELRSSTNRAAVLSGAARLYCPQVELPAAQRGTIYYRDGKTWNTFDSVHVSRTLLAGGPAGGWRLPPGGFAVCRDPRLLTADGLPRSFRRFKNRQTGRWEYQTGYSDHLPLRTTLVRP